MKKKTYKKYMNELYKSIIVAYNGDDETWASMSVHQKGIKGRRFKKILNNPIIQDSIDLGFGNIPNPSGSLADTCDFNIFIGKVEFINPRKKYCIFMRQHNPNYGYTDDSDYKTWIEIRRMDKLPYEKHVHIDKFYPRWTNNVTENNKGTKFKRMEMSNRLIYKKLRRYCKYPHKISGSLLIAAAKDFRIPDSWETTNELGCEAFLTSTGIHVPVRLMGIEYGIKCDKDRDYIISIENNCVHVKEA